MLRHALHHARAVVRTHRTSVARNILVNILAAALAWVGVARSDADDAFVGWVQRQDITAIEATLALLAGLVCTAVAFVWRRWQRARRASEEKYRTLVEQAADGIVLTRLDGTIIEVNAATLTLTGYEPDELLGRNASEIVPPTDLATHPHRAKAVRAGQIVQSQRRLRRKDGTPRYVEVSVRRLGEDLVQGIWRDVTTQREAEAALRQSAESFADLFDAASEAIAITEGGRVVTINRAYTTLLGYTPEEVIGHKATEFPDPSDRERIAAYIDMGYTKPYEVLHPHKDGSLVPVELLGTAIRYRGRPARLTTLRDISARKEAETALRAEERRSRELYAAADRQTRELALLDQVRTALARELDPAAVFRTIVEAIASIFGHTRVSLYLLEGDELVRQQVVGRPSRLVRLPMTRGIMGRVARTGQPVLLEDVNTDPEFIRALDSIVSEVCVPLTDKDRVIGVLNLESVDGVHLVEADLRLMMSLSAQFGIAIERARLYNAARTNAEQLATAQAIAQLGSWEEDLRTGRASWSDETYRIFGHIPQAFVPTATTFYAAIHPDDHARVREAHARQQAGDPVRDLEYRIVRPDGAIRHVQDRAQLLRDAADRPERVVGTVLDITERKALEAELAHQATHDLLTGLPNRALLLDRLGYALARARRDGRSCAVLLLDLDRFKDVNDSRGHEVGDQLLMAVATRLRRCLRDEDTLARLGGDEFTVLLEDVADPGEAARLAERLARTLDQPFTLDGEEHRVTVSVGVVLASPDYARPEEVLRDADVAMYRAKESGKARYAIFDPAMQAAVQARLELERDLRLALERDELLLHFQPIVELQSGCIVETEALVRWQHPLRGLVPPGEFIPLAEETGLIRPLGRWVLRAACAQAAAWARLGYPLNVAVNLTTQEFQQPSLAGEVAAVLGEVGLAPGQLRLEITESLAMRDVEATIATLTALRALGVEAMIDDFGTGYSSLAALKRLPVAALKVDRAFVAALETDPEGAAIVRAVVTLGQTLGLRVVAEGVETAEQATQLQALGCDLAQGYYFSRPLPTADLLALLARGAGHGTARGHAEHALHR